MLVDKNATRALMGFVRSYTDLMEHQLQAVHDVMREAVENVMVGINKISEKTADKKRAANEVLVKTYTDPDAEAEQAMASAQDEVNQIIDEATSGLFSKHMEALETLDGDLQNLLLEMMGALSRDDVMAQRIQHVIQAMSALQTSLTYVLTDFEQRCRTEEIERFAKDLKSFTLRTYTMEDEKQAFYDVFPEDRPVKRKKTAT